MYYIIYSQLNVYTPGKVGSSGPIIVIYQDLFYVCTLFSMYTIKNLLTYLLPYYDHYLMDNNFKVFRIVLPLL
jgi:hypothetical protein